MNTKLIKENKAINEFYENETVRKRLNSANPVNGALELAYFDTQRTFRGISKNPNRKIFKQGIFEVVSKFYDELVKNFEFYSIKDYDGSFLILCDKIIDIGKKFDYKIYFGQAQKIFNMFFKYMILVDERLNCHLNYFHIPFDSIILNGISHGIDFANNIRSIAKGCSPWSKMENADNYFILQEYFRNIKECPIIFEFEVWNEWK